MFIDSHAHIEMGDYEKDRDEVVRRALEKGIDAIIAVGIEVKDSARAVKVAEKYEMVYATVGVHPHHAREIEQSTYDVLKKLACHKKVVAYGEIGLDFFRDLSPRDIQIQRFGEQLEIAFELGLPVIIHDREAHAETVAMLESWKGKLRGVVHCFSGDYDMACKCIDMGFSISIPGTITYKGSDILRDVVRRVPLDSLLIETDAPFLSPEPRRGKRNEPANVYYTARKVADIRGLPLNEIGKITSRNAKDVFSLS